MLASLGMFSYLVLVVTQITHTEFGSAVTHSLKTGGESIPVTNSNRHGLFFFILSSSSSLVLAHENVDNKQLNTTDTGHQIKFKFIINAKGPVCH